MKKIEAIIRPTKLEELKDALIKENISGITISQVLGCGNQYGYKEYYRASELILNVLPKVEIKMVVEDEKVDSIVKLIMSIAKTGEVGDGKIFVTDVCNCIRIRTGEEGLDAL
ncbi:P-II family nitrogen regulator [Clostridium bornimense]|uniref:P-II family nitrogen regulator n=1 Tax=Clostridium bornimense TaxID=1216932 RepID=UPI001C123918|nr:P-II family nitrogen regulator [Clostridium bornimense]MBU5316692.1 P-II family nitrogen regulator [Clostridium bornimense]